MTRLDQSLFTANVQNCVLLTVERRVRKIFGGCRRAYRYFASASGPLTQTSISGDNRFMYRGWQRSIEHQRAGFASGLVQRFQVFIIETVHQLAQPLAKTICLEQKTIRLARGGEAVDGAYSLWHKGAKQFAETGTFPADQLDVASANLA